MSKREFHNSVSDTLSKGKTDFRNNLQIQKDYFINESSNTKPINSRSEINLLRQRKTELSQSIKEIS